MDWRLTICCDFWVFYSESGNSWECLKQTLLQTANKLQQANKAPNCVPLGELTRWRKSSPTFSVQALCCRPQRGNRFPKFVLPSALVLMVFAFFHSSPACGHVGILKTIGKIRQNFIWKGMDRNIAGRVRSCQLCALSKPAQNSQLGFLATKVANLTMKKVFIDLVGLFPRNNQGNTMLLLCVDSFSKFVWRLPLRRATLLTLQYRPFPNISGFPKLLSVTTVLSSHPKSFVECASAMELGM